MPDDDAATAPSPAPIPGPTPTGYQRTQGGGVKWLPPTTEQLSKLLPQYDIECLLGRGGMGAVYKGTQKSLKRAVAIKILPPEVDDEDASYTERFKNEAQILARLSHPGIVAVHDFGETSEGQLYIVMEFIDGSDVAQMIAAQGRLPPEHALAIAAHVCDALAYAHKNGVVHRDIKPANILINMDGAVKVADFGLAKLDEPGTTGLTKTGMAMGTPDYVAPEALIMGVQVDGRADLYAVGVMLYHMLTGQVPRGAFDLPSKRLGTDPRFDAIIQKAMQMDRDSRYQSSAEIRRDLDVILTMPLLQHGGQSSAAIPKQSLPARNASHSVAGGPQKPVGRPQQQKQATPTPNHKSQIVNHKSKTPLFIGLGVAAAVAVGAFFMSSRARQSVDDTPRAAATNPDQTLASSATPAAAEKRGASWSAAGSVSATPLSSAPTPAKSTTTTPASTAPAPNPKAVSPTPPGVSATALQNAAAKPAVPAAIPPKPAPEKKAEPRPVAAAPAPPPTAAPAASGPQPARLPDPAKWVKVFETPESVANLVGKEWTPEGILVKSGGGLRVLETNKIDVAVKAKCRLNLTNDISIRNTGQAEAIFLDFGGTRTRGEITFRQKGSQPGSFARTLLASFELPTTTSASQEIEVQFVAVEKVLAVYFDGKLISSVTHDVEPFAGTIQVGAAGNLVRDIAWQSLDVPAEEKLAAAKAMEQKQVAQAAAGIPELAVLDEQFKKLTSERVTAPFEAEVAKLNSGYLGGLDRKRAEEKAAGHLDSVLAIEAEKKLITDQQPIPSAEDDATSTTTLAVLKGLRQIYRDAYAKIEATRAANLKALTDPLTTRLKTLESDLTKKDRIADAKTVKEYREGLASRSGGLQPPSPSPSGSAPPAPTPAVGNAPLLAAALKDGFTNSLGMKFVKVPGTDVLFCIHETRYKDYAAYAAEAPGVEGSWKDQSADGFTLTDRPEEHPVMKVSWDDAQKFCAWLSKKEGKTYRLSTDQEWSIAVGIGRDEKWKEDTTPATVAKNQTEFPWGDKWPPPKGSGNYSDESRKAQAPMPTVKYIDGYDDGFPTTAPVMTFKPNKLGLYDLGGNVREWVEDWYDNAQKDRLLRGGCWGNNYRETVLSSTRFRLAPDTYNYNCGFRIVVDLKAPAAKAATAPAAAPPAPATAAKSDFSNSLGMKFVKLPGTQVLFCIHETRRQDYAAYAAAVAGVQDVNTLWRDQNKDGIPISDKDDHPVVSVNWDDANAFSTWLSKKEGRKYRLPTDKEWSFAVGIGREEKWTKDSTPEMRHSGLPGVFPWNGGYPPSTKDQAGNYADSSWHDQFPGGQWMEGYTDGFPTTSPVMSFKPNKQGIYDLGGNVWEWCEDLHNPTKTDRLIRGSAYSVSGVGNLRSSDRHPRTPATRGNDAGFRIVVEMTAP